MQELKKISPAVWEIEKTGKMNVPGRVFANDEVVSFMGKDRTLGQLRNVATLPGIVKYAAVMPDAHEGYGFPIGGVAAFDAENGGVVSPGGVGFDINCLLPESKVLCELGYFVPIEKLGENMQMNINSNGFEATLVQNAQRVAVLATGKTNRVLAFMKKKSDMKNLRIITKTGKEVRCSYEHPIQTIEGMIEAGKIRVGQKIGVNYFGGVSYTKTQWKDEYEMGIITKVFGYMLGDGSLSNSSGNMCMRVYGEEEDMKRMKEDLARIGINSNYVHRESQTIINGVYGEKGIVGSSHELRIYSREFAKRLVSLGYPIGKKTSNKYGVPKWIFDSPLWIKRLFLAGFFGAELSSPATHTRTGFYAPILAQNKLAALEEDGREFMIDIMNLLEEFGVRCTKISSKRVGKNSDGETVRLRLEISAEENNLLELYSKIGFEYNEKRTILSNIACAYILEKKKLQKAREGIACRTKELRAKGLRLREVQRLLCADKIVNERFVERHYYEKNAGQRIGLNYELFEQYMERRWAECKEFGYLHDEVEKIEELEYNGEVFDINVEDAHKFFADGVLVSNCGVRLLTVDIEPKDLKKKKKELVEKLFENVPSGVGVKGKLRLNEKELRNAVEQGVAWAVEKGYGREEDLKTCEENGCIAGAEWKSVSQRARGRGLNQLGTVGSGNHFIELQEVEKILNPKVAKRFGLRDGQIVVMIHSGSRGFGHQICTDYVGEMIQASKKYGIELADEQLCCAPLDSPEALKYFGAMNAAVNFAFNNRQLMTHWTRESFDSVFGKGTSESMNLVYDVCHNIAKYEKHLVDGKMREVCVHRKGATRAFASGREEVPLVYREVGQPVIIPGSMGTASYVLVGAKGAMEHTFGSSCHGAGRMMSRAAAKREWSGEQITADLGRKNILVRATEPDLVSEEAPGAYKDVDAVVASVAEAGLCSPVARLIPHAVVKG